MYWKAGIGLEACVDVFCTVTCSLYKRLKENCVRGSVRAHMQFHRS